MRGAIESLAFNLPLAIIILIPIYFLNRKKLEQRYHWGIFVVMWLVLALVNPHKGQEIKANTPQLPPPVSNNAPLASSSKTSSSNLDDTDNEKQAFINKFHINEYDRAISADFSKLAVEIESYYIDHQTYPDNLEQINFVPVNNDIVLDYKTKFTTYNGTQSKCYDVIMYHKRGNNAFGRFCNEAKSFIKPLTDSNSEWSEQKWVLSRQ
jgi:hypothetical protein